MRVAGYEVELLPLIDKHRERYAGWIANNICDGVFNGFRGVKSVILVGGGAEMVEPFLREWYGEKVVDRKKLPHTRRIHRSMSDGRSAPGADAAKAGYIDQMPPTSCALPCRGCDWLAAA